MIQNLIAQKEPSNLYCKKALLQNLLQMSVFVTV